MLVAHLISQLEQLLPNKDSRFAIAFSGGGDSTALVHALKNHPQRGPVFIVDHALRSGSHTEASAAKTFAEICGYETKVLTWDNNVPKTGLQEKARRARYGLMGDECRRAAIGYLLTAHSLDDQAETLLMRYDKHTDWRGAAGMSGLTYAPVWPELAEVNICRPLLGVTRQALRDYNMFHNLHWAEDPSNQNRDYSRIRARDYLKTHSALKSDLIETAHELSNGVSWECENLLAELKTAQFGLGGEIVFQSMPSVALLGLGLRSVGGGGASIPSSRLRALHKKLKLGEVGAITLLGAQAVKDKEALIVSRDPVAVRGRSDSGLKPRAISMPLTAEAQIWDGRFMVSSTTEGYQVRANFGLDVPRSQRLKKCLAALHRSVRPISPVIIREGMAYAYDEIECAEVISLVKPRLEAALLGKQC